MDAKNEAAGKLPPQILALGEAMVEFNQTGEGEGRLGLTDGRIERCELGLMLGGRHGQIRGGLRAARCFGRKR